MVVKSRRKRKDMRERGGGEGGVGWDLCIAPLRGAFKEAAKSISRGFRVRSWEPAF